MTLNEHEHILMKTELHELESVEAESYEFLGEEYNEAREFYGNLWNYTGD